MIHRKYNDHYILLPLSHDPLNYSHTGTFSHVTIVLLSEPAKVFSSFLTTLLSQTVLKFPVSFKMSF